MILHKSRHFRCETARLEVCRICFPVSFYSGEREIIVVREIFGYFIAVKRAREQFSLVVEQAVTDFPDSLNVQFVLLGQ